MTLDKIDEMVQYLSQMEESVFAAIGQKLSIHLTDTASLHSGITELAARAM